MVEPITFLRPAQVHDIGMLAFKFPDTLASLHPAKRPLHRPFVGEISALKLFGTDQVVLYLLLVNDPQGSFP